MTKNIDPNLVMGGRAMQIVADNHPERFTYENGHLFLDGSSVGDPLTNALRPDTLLMLIRRSKAQKPVEPMTEVVSITNVLTQLEAVLEGDLVDAVIELWDDVDDSTHIYRYVHVGNRSPFYRWVKEIDMELESAA